MQKLKSYLSSKRGEIHITTCVLIIAILMIFIVLMNYTMTTVLAKGQRKSAIQVLDQYTQANAIDIYNSIKLCNDDTESLDPDAYIADLIFAQSLEASDGTYTSTSANGTKRYEVSDVAMSFYVENTTKIRVSYTLTVPLKFMGLALWVDIPVTITTSLNAKYDASADTATKDVILYFVDPNNKTVGSNQIIAGMPANAIFVTLPDDLVVPAGYHLAADQNLVITSDDGSSYATVRVEPD